MLDTIYRKKLVLALVYLFVLSGVSLGSYMIYHRNANSYTNAPPDNDTFHSQLIQAPPNYNVLEDFKTRNGGLTANSFGELELVKTKHSRANQVLVKDADIIGEYSDPDKSMMYYFVQRTKKEEEQQWTQIDLLLFDPATQGTRQAPIAIVEGDWGEAAAKGTQLSGFAGKDTFIFISPRSQKNSMVYTVNRMELKDLKVVPLFDFARIESGPNPKAVYRDSWLAKDQQTLAIRSHGDQIKQYSLKTAESTVLLEASAHDTATSSLLLSPDKKSGVYVSEPYRNNAWLLNFGSKEKKQPFLTEKGYVEPGFDDTGTVLYYNFTYSPSPERILKGERRTLLQSRGVQVMDLKGNSIKRFALPQDGKEGLEFAGYVDDRKVVLLHKYVLEQNTGGQPYKKTVDWLTGDLKTGDMLSLVRLNVPDNWDKKDVYLATATMDSFSENARQHAFVNLLDGTYVIPRWMQQEIAVSREEDLVLYLDDSGKRVDMTSFTRPDLVVTTLNYKKHNMPPKPFYWTKTHWLVRVSPAAGGQWIFSFPVN